MAPNKFDEQIKQKLEARNITPSKQVWFDLEERLDDGKNKKYKAFLQFGVAASIVAILFTSIWVLDTPDKNSIVPVIVDTEDTLKDSKTNLIKTSNKVALDKNTYADTNNSLEGDGLNLTNTVNDKQKQVSTNRTIANTNTQKSPKSFLETVPNNENIQIVSANSLTKQDFKIIEVVAEISEFEKRNGSVSESEIDSLLKQAEKEILKQRIFKETTRVVDANALLKDVEEEIDQTFRAKVFEALKTSIEKVKTAVAERND